MWAFIVCRDNCVETIKLFEAYFEGEKYSDIFIRGVDPNLKEMPKYRQNEFFKNEELSIGLYKQSRVDSLI